MPATENLFQTTQKFLDPVSVQHLSSELGEPQDKIQTGLRSVIPTFMSELISKGSTYEGAEEIAHLAEDVEFDQDRLMDEIFGDHFHSMASELAPETGLSQNFLERLMTFIAPSIMRALNKTIVEEKMTPEDLKVFLQQQRNVVKKSRPFFKTVVPRYKNRNRSIALAALMFILFSAVFFWLFSREKQTVETITTELSDVHKASTTKESLITGVEELSFFLKNGKASELPARFAFKDLSFVIGSTDLKNTGNGELDYVAETLKRYPKSVIRIEGYIENTGDPEENLLQSENRAMIVREELIARGIEPSRVRAEGRGPTIGRGQVELVVQRLK